MKKAKSECAGGEGGPWKPGGGQPAGTGPPPDLSSTPRRHTLSRRRIIPLPQWKANPETDPEALFQKEQLVLALYPQTTCFYRALIHTPPQRVRQPPQERPSLTSGPGGQMAPGVTFLPPSPLVLISQPLSSEGPASCSVFCVICPPALPSGAALAHPPLSELQSLSEP